MFINTKNSKLIFQKACSGVSLLLKVFFILCVSGVSPVFISAYVQCTHRPEGKGVGSPGTRTSGGFVGAGN